MRYYIHIIKTASVLLEFFKRLWVEIIEFTLLILNLLELFLKLTRKI